MMRQWLNLLFVSWMLLMTSPPIEAMNKAELIDAIAQVAGMEKSQTRDALNALTDIISSSLQRRGGGRVALVGFGSFSISKRAARTGRNPQTGKEIKIAAKNVVRFKAGADLSDKINRRRHLLETKETTSRRKLSLLDFQKPEKVIMISSDDVNLFYSGDITNEMKKIVEKSKLGSDQGSNLIKTLQQFGKENGHVVAFDSPSIHGHSGSQTSLLSELESRANLPPSIAQTFLDTFEIFIPLALAGRVLQTSINGQVEALRVSEININKFGQFTLNRAAGHVEFDPSPSWTVPIMNGIRLDLLDQIEREVNQVIRFVGAFRKNTKCVVNDEDTCNELKKREQLMVKFSCGIMVTEKQAPRESKETQKLSRESATSKNAACFQKHIKAEMQPLLTSVASALLKADEYGDLGSVRAQTNQLLDIMTQNIEPQYKLFYGLLLMPGDGDPTTIKASGTRVRKGMQELRNVAQEIRVEVQQIKNRG